MPLDEVRDELRRQQVRHRWITGLAAAAMVLVLAVVLWRMTHFGRQVAELSPRIEQATERTIDRLTDPSALAETLRRQIRATAEEKITALPDEPGRWRLVAAIEQERDLALGRVDELIRLIQAGLKEGASPVFQRATEILQKEGRDAALAYLESRRQSTLESARGHAEQARIAQAHADAETEQRNKTLQPLTLEADLLETKLQWQAALQLRAQVAELAPDWFAARNHLGKLLHQLARHPEAEPHSRAALALAANPAEEAIARNNLAQLLQATNRLAEAEPLMRRALAIDEQSYGAAHPTVATRLNNLAQLLQATNRLAEAEPLLRRAVTIFVHFTRRTGHEHPHQQTALANYAGLLEAMTLPDATIKERLQDAKATTMPLQPIMPDIERVLGPAQPVADILAALDRQYKEEGKPAIYFLAPEQPLAPHLDALLTPHPEALNAAGVHAYRQGDHASAIAHYDEALTLLAEHRNQAALTFTVRMNRAAALRELGEAEQARAALRTLLSGPDAEHPSMARSKGRAHYHLALCEWRLNDREAAQRQAQASLQTYGDDADAAALKKQTAQLLTDLQKNTPLPALAPIDTVIALQTARTRLRARLDLATLPLQQSALALLDHMLGPAEPTTETLERLDRQYREQHKPAVWFLPLEQPIAPHLDALLGPAPGHAKKE